ncbi:proline iminopeptidase-family hydrolase [Frigoribacterium faeni]|uniref:Proline iminopeptidase n=1 Tax=Frigoribacterium faeni TaxID=145483 RepID=A0A7W3JJV3_9MICO|nr:proline iminopeptidase-family hydrolase [Frigoribacterium faeni]MBA8814221.1 L-proline amide hydrolase [Frigoribacterium faeni]BFF16286.1 proline iminopeptidase-family hydrolase [Microbacterium flavescens]GEK83686.1 amino acid amidase [Frigoribacterium faeni]
MSASTSSTLPFRDGETWFQVTAPDEPRPGALPLVVLHGGPGMAHDYLRNLAALADETGRTVVHYDQFGCGRSSHRPDAPVETWTPAFFVAEFDALVAHLGLDRFHVLGQSWGGMLGAEIAVRQPRGLASLAICNSPASMQLWVDGAAELRAQLPTETEEALRRHEEDGTTSDPEYLAATQVFYERHVCRVLPMPQDFVDSEAQMEAEPTVYHTMNGPNEFHVIGTMRDWSIVDRLPSITAPTLVVAGEFDEATPATWLPFVESIADVRSHVLPGASHCAHLEQPEAFRAVVAAFLAEHDDA